MLATCRRLALATLAMLLATNAVALADTTVSGLLTVQAGSTNENWAGIAIVQAGSTPRVVAGVLDLKGPNGFACTNNSQCTSNMCASGVCCNTVCNAGACQACNVPGSVGTCTTVPAATVCRAAAGACDVAEVCNGTALTCPADVLLASTITCRADNAQGCDVAELCTGTSAACPADAGKANGFVCRTSAAGGCDTAETCNGTSAACPANGYLSSATVCRAATDLCDAAENCSGTSATCPADGMKANGTSCRVAAGVCDAAEVCTGASKVCPADVKLAVGTTCRAAVAGGCDLAETCTGTNVCPADAVKAVGTLCRANNGGGCDVQETCNGSNACPGDVGVAAGTVCRAAGASPTCDPAESCNGSPAACPGQVFAGTGVLCRGGNGVCNPAEYCNGAGSCPGDAFANTSTLCRGSAGQCDVAEYCDGGGWCPNDGFAYGNECRGANGDCNPAELCPGNSPHCPGDALAADATACTTSEAQAGACAAGNCIENCTWVGSTTRITNVTSHHDALTSFNPLAPHRATLESLGFTATHTQAVQAAGAEGVWRISEESMSLSTDPDVLLDKGGFWGLCPSTTPLQPDKIKNMWGSTFPSRDLVPSDNNNTRVAPNVLNGCPASQYNIADVPYQIYSYLNRQWGGTCSDHLVDQCGLRDVPAGPSRSPAAVDQGARALWWTAFNYCTNGVDNNGSFHWCDGDTWNGARGLDNVLCTNFNDDGRNCICTRMANQFTNEMAFGNGWVSHINLVYTNLPGLGGTGAPPLMNGTGALAPDQITDIAAARGNPPYNANFDGGGYICVPNSRMVDWL